MKIEIDCKICINEEERDDDFKALQPVDMVGMVDKLTKKVGDIFQDMADKQKEKKEQAEKKKED